MTTAQQTPGRADHLKELAVRHSTLLVLVALVVAATVLSRGVFITPDNLTTLLYQNSVLGLLVIGQTFVIITRGIDLSVGATTILAAIVVGAMSSAQQAYLPFIGAGPALAVGLCAALIVGLLNGLAVAGTRIPPFIVTLVMLLVASGVSYLITGGSPISYPAELFVSFGEAKLWILPLPVLAWVAMLVVGHLLLTRTRFGPMIYAVGGNERASFLSGLRVGRILTLVYAVSGLMAGIAGVLFLSRTGYAVPSAGADYLLDSIAAVAVGGVSLAGGRGTLKDALMGVLILAILSNLMNVMLVSPYIQSAVKGAVILFAVAINLRLAEKGGR